LKDNQGRRVMEPVEEGTAGEGREEVRKNSESKKTIEIVFWNIAGLKRKYRAFWDYLEKFNVIDLCETWIKKREWGNLKLRLSRNFVWKCEYAVIKRKGRAR